MHRYADRFSDATGLSVVVEAATDIPIDDRLAGELFQMVVEGLSNVRRHTNARHATVALSRRARYLSLRIENEGTQGIPYIPFTPRSMAERAAALGGRLRVEPRSDKGAAVVVEVPV
jgi:signal transduction histidine kinase